MTDNPNPVSRSLADLATVSRGPAENRPAEGLPPGSTVGRFLVEREIGRGGFGVVYAALDPELGRSVALKLLHPGLAPTHADPDWTRREAEAVARLSDPAIVTLYDAGRTEEGAYLVFELLHGESLADRLARGPLGAQETLRIATAVASALHHAHAAGVLHRDLKPANVFLCSSGSVKVLDFGIAQLFGREGPPTGGTRGYMAPEQRDGKGEDARTDLYSLGVVLQAMLGGEAGEVPDAPRPRNAGSLQRLAWDLIRPEPEHRPPSARAVLDRLGAIRRRRANVRRGWGAAALLAVALATWAIADRFGTHEAPPGERLIVVLAPTRNETGVPELDHFTEMLRTGLSDSPRFRVVAGPRVDASMRNLGKDPASADDSTRREAAAAVGAQVVVLPEARKEGSDLVVTLTGRDVASGENRFLATARAPTLEALPAALDRAVLDMRRRAGERAEDLARNQRSLSGLTTPNLAAYREFSEAVKCEGDASGAMFGDAVRNCLPGFRRALELDPAFGLARLEMAGILALTTNWEGADAREQVAAALALPGRLSRRDDGRARALRDRLAGNDAAALERYVALVAEYPEDTQIDYVAAEFLFHSSRFAEAIAYLSRLADLGPSYEWAFDHLVESYGVTDRSEDLARLLRENDPPKPERLQAVMNGELWLGRHDRAVERARQAQEVIPGTPGDALMFRALNLSGRYDEAEGVMAGIQASARNSVPMYVDGTYFAVKRGRSAKAWRILEAHPRDIPHLNAEDLTILKFAAAAGDRNLPRLRGETQKLLATGTDYASVVATQLAFLGTPDDLPAMREAAKGTPKALAEIDAIDAWKKGDSARAASLLTALERAEPRPNFMLSPAYLLAEVTREDAPAEALAAAARFRQRIPIGSMGTWSFGRSLLVSAEAAWRLDRREEALEFIDQAERLLRGADAGFPLARETARLRGAIESGAPPQKGVHFGPR